MEAIGKPWSPSSKHHSRSMLKLKLGPSHSVIGLSPAGIATSPCSGEGGSVGSKLQRLASGFLSPNSKRARLRLRSAAVASTEVNPRNARQATDIDDETPSPASGPKRVAASAYRKLHLCPAREVAEELTLMDAEMLRRISPDELKNGAWMGKDKNELAPNIIAMVQSFNRLALLVPTEVLEEKTPQGRAKVVSHLIKIADKCHNLRNLNALKAVLAGLQSMAVFRLEKTWREVPARRKKLFTNLSKLMSEENNYSVYRQELATLMGSRVPCLPFLGFLLTQAAHLQCANQIGYSKKRLTCNNSSDSIGQYTLVDAVTTTIAHDKSGSVDGSEENGTKENSAPSNGTSQIAENCACATGSQIPSTFLGGEKEEEQCCCCSCCSCSCGCAGAASTDRSSTSSVSSQGSCGCHSVRITSLRGGRPCRSQSSHSLLMLYSNSDSNSSHFSPKMCGNERAVFTSGGSDFSNTISHTRNARNEALNAKKRSLSLGLVIRTVSCDDAVSERGRGAGGRGGGGCGRLCCLRLSHSSPTQVNDPFVIMHHGGHRDHRGHGGLQGQKQEGREGVGEGEEEVSVSGAKHRRLCLTLKQWELLCDPVEELQRLQVNSIPCCLGLETRPQLRQLLRSAAVNSETESYKISLSREPLHSTKKFGHARTCSF